MYRAISPALPLLLASASPRRSELLRAAVVPIVVAPVDVDESARPSEEPDAYLERIVGAKLGAARAAPAPPHAAVLVADTIVVVDGRMLAKPVDDDEALEMVLALSGRAHRVSTRYAVAPAGGADHREETVTTRVFVRGVGEAWGRRYVATGEGRDKAGAYAIQGIFSAAVTRIEGSYSNVVGLPVAEVIVALEELGLLPDHPRLPGAGP